MILKTGAFENLVCIYGNCFKDPQAFRKIKKYTLY